MPQPAFLNKALVALKEWLPYQASWLIEFQSDSTHSIIKFSHGQTKVSLPVTEIVAQLQQARAQQPLPMVITQASLLAHHHHKLQQGLRQLLAMPYLIFTDCSMQPGRALLLIRTDNEQYFSDRDRMMAEWLLPHLCEASRLSPQQIGAHVDKAPTQMQVRSPLELHLNKQNQVTFCGEYIRACINNCPKTQENCQLDDQQQLTLSNKLIKQIYQHLSAGYIQLDKLIFDLTPRDDLLVIRVRPDSIQYLLTARERQIAAELAQGLSYKEVAKNLHLSPSTVTNYANRIYRKLNVHSKSQLAHLYTLSEAELITH